jgi:hypothetical protein
MANTSMIYLVQVTGMHRSLVFYTDILRRKKYRLIFLHRDTQDRYFRAMDDNFYFPNQIYKNEITAPGRVTMYV